MSLERDNNIYYSIIQGVAKHLNRVAIFWLYKQTVADLAVIYFSVNFVYGAIGGIGSIHSAWQSARANMQRMSEILNISLEKEGGQVLDPFCKEIFYLKQVGMYRENKTLYENVNFVVNRGDFIVISGPSGAGKTTLVELMLGIEKPTSGYIYAYNSNIEDLDKKLLYQKIAVCPQIPVLLKGSVLTNVVWDDIDNSGPDVDAILHVLLLDEQKTQSIKTRGVGVSGGQALRIGIARALYSNREVIILDEPSSALDHVTEEKVYELLCKLKAKKTIILISHRERFYDLADKRISIGNGDTILSERNGFQ